jgi:hypothetical protein
MTTTDLLTSLAGALLLALIAVLLFRWRRYPVRSVTPPYGSNLPETAPGSIAGRLPAVRGRLLWLLVQRGSGQGSKMTCRVASEVVAEVRSLLARRQMIEAIMRVPGHAG